MGVMKRLLEEKMDKGNNKDDEVIFLKRQQAYCQDCLKDVGQVYLAEGESALCPACGGDEEKSA